MCLRVGLDLTSKAAILGPYVAAGPRVRPSPFTLERTIASAFFDGPAAQVRTGALVLAAFATFAVFSPEAQAQQAQEMTAPPASRFSVDLGGRAQTIEGFGTSVFSSASDDFYDFDRFADVLVNDFNAEFLRIELSHQALTNPRFNADGTANSTFAPTAPNSEFGAGFPQAAQERFQLDYTTPVVLNSTAGLDASARQAALNENIGKFDFRSLRTNIGVSAANAVLDRKADARIIASIWTPPHWLKGEEARFGELPDAAGNLARVEGTGPRFGGFAASDSGGGTLERAQIGQFAEYVAAYVKGLEEREGIKLDALSIQNEPGNFAGLSHQLVNAELYADALVAVNEAFDRNGIQTKLIGPEAIGPGSTERTRFGALQGPDLNAFNQQAEAIEAVWEREQALGRQLFDGYAIHGSDGFDRRSLRGDTVIDFEQQWEFYLNGLGNQSDGTLVRPDGFPVLDDGTPRSIDLASFDGILDDPNVALGERRFNWQTENSGAFHQWVSPTGLDNIDGTTYEPSGLDQAVSLHHALASGDASAYLFWQLTRPTGDGEIAVGEGNRPANVEVLIITDETQVYDTSSKKFASALHYTRFARAGSVRYDLDLQLAEESQRGTRPDGTPEGFIGDLLGSLYVDEDTLDVSLVFVNTFSSSQTVDIDLNGLDEISAGWVASLTDGFSGVVTDEERTFFGLGPEDISFENGILTVLLAAESLTSLTSNATFIPEPGSALLLAGVGGMLLRRRRRLA